jgi:UDP-N-acetylglucosamine--N-acetylmuramyl-(pentapeptide) pyrophosphoryl-undecaprenol N-acetylglucosamine transferase
VSTDDLGDDRFGGDRALRLLITGGGTGGHTYPALTAVRAADSRLGVHGAVAEVLWIGTANGLEAHVAEREGIRFVAVAAGKIRRARNPMKMLSWANVKDMGKVPLGVVQAVRAVAVFRPDVVLATGGYVSVPVSLAAWVCRRPLVVHEQTVRLGLANRLLARIATTMAVSSASTLPFLREGPGSVRWSRGIRCDRRCLPGMRGRHLRCSGWRTSTRRGRRCTSPEAPRARHRSTS